MNRWNLLICSVLIMSLLDTDAGSAAAGFDFPLVAPIGEEWVVTQEFLDPGPCANGTKGVFHPGDDYALVSGSLGEPVYAAADGVIVFAAEGDNNGYGTLVLVQHEGTFRLPDQDGQDSGETVMDPLTAQAHLSKISINPETGLPWRAGNSITRGQLIGEVGGTGGYTPHFHLEVRLKKTDPLLYPCGFKKSEVQFAYADPSDFIALNPPVEPPEAVVTYLTQNDPGEVGKDIWTTSVFCYCPGGGGPGGGKDDEALVVGGWGDRYHALLQFDLRDAPLQAFSVRLELFAFRSRSGRPTGLYLDRVTTAWDWRVAGTGRDMDRLWWRDRPNATQWIPELLPAPTIGEWYSIDVTDLYNAWQEGTFPNYGIQLRPGPIVGNNTWSEFYSANYEGDPSLRPRLVVVP